MRVVMCVRTIFLLLAAVCVALPALAQQEYVDMAKIKEIPDYAQELTPEQYAAQSELYEETPQGDAFVAFRVRLPKGWFKAPSTVAMEYKKDEKEKAGLNQRILGRIAKYYGPGRIDELSKFEIHAQALEHEVTAKNWFLQEILNRGYVLEGMNIHSDRRVEVQYVMVEKDTAFVVRALAEINGPRIVVASFHVPDNHWQEERAQQQRAIESFEFLHPEKNKIEMKRSYAFLDLLSFEYPASWRLIAPNILSEEAMEAKILHSPDNKVIGGEIHISILSTEFDMALQDELDFLKQEITGRGMVLGDLMETKKDYKLPEHVRYNHTEVYKAVDSLEKVAEHEYWVSIMEEDRYFYVVTMITPGRRGEFYTWARNAEAFQVVVESFKP